MKTVYKFTYNKEYRIVEYPAKHPHFPGEQRALILYQTGKGWCYKIGATIPFNPRDPRDSMAIKLTPAQVKRFLLEIKL